jgi:hypothetical protein
VLPWPISLVNDWKFCIPRKLSLGNLFNSYHMNLQWHFCDKKLALIWCNAIKSSRLISLAGE